LATGWKRSSALALTQSRRTEAIRAGIRVMPYPLLS
jgi:hypothetical protein